VREKLKGGNTFTGRKVTVEGKQGKRNKSDAVTGAKRRPGPNDVTQTQFSTEKKRVRNSLRDRQNYEKREIRGRNKKREGVNFIKTKSSKDLCFVKSLCYKHHEY